MNHHHGTGPTPSNGVVRIAAMADVHCKRTSQNVLRPFFEQAADSADVLLLCGDLTDYGLPEEARILADQVTAATNRIPVLAVLGNHDHECGKADEVLKILCDSGITMLDGNCQEVFGIGFTGVKGFAGGFDERSLQPWGEDSIKQFVHETVDEALRLESGLAKLESQHRVVLLHYSPVRATVEGEPLEIYPFLGSSRLEEPLNHFPVSAVFHGHAHHGSPEGRTRSGTPVYNVAVPVLKRNFPGQPPFRVLELAIAEEAVEQVTA